MAGGAGEAGGHLEGVFGESRGEVVGMGGTRTRRLLHRSRASAEELGCLYYHGVASG